MPVQLRIPKNPKIGEVHYDALGGVMYMWTGHGWTATSPENINANFKWTGSCSAKINNSFWWLSNGDKVDDWLKKFDTYFHYDTGTIHFKHEMDVTAFRLKWC
ncbi:MAG: hypothetical protein DRQ47_04520 [Gammaproteobacteria bacterium]|nr:MAG: hypothetical protein DRQ47_04520 [Gammaproteobacteria bacterium]